MKRYSRSSSVFFYYLILIGISVYVLPLKAALLSTGNGWKAGVAKADITPAESMWMAGYASRTKSAEGKMHSLWAKVLVLEDASGNRSIIVSTDMLGFPKGISEYIKSGLYRKYGISKAQIMLNSSHTHSGPVLSHALVDIYPFGAADKAKIENYSNWLQDRIIYLVSEAIANIEAVTLQSGIGVTRFQVNRRNNNAANLEKVYELKGPNDHAVPVVRVKAANGDVKVVLFSYACHPTVLNGYEWSGDYAGFAQLELEKLYPGSVAMFLQGAGGDQNPLPRHSKALAIQYGKELSAAVDRVLTERSMKELAPELRTNYTEIQLPLQAAPSEKDLLEIIRQQKGTYVQRWAERLLGRLKKGKPLDTSYPYPIQAWKIGDQLVMGLGGELLVGYDLKIKEIFGWNTFVIGYCNDVMAYIPTEVVLKEGGYEGDSAQQVYGLPAKWQTGIENKIYEACKKVVDGLK